MNALLCKNPEVDLKNLVEKYVEFHQDDFKIDINILKKAENGAVYIWILRTSGTNMVREGTVFLENTWGRSVCENHLSQYLTKAFYVVKEKTEGDDFACTLYPIDKRQLRNEIEKHCYPLEYACACIDGDEVARAPYDSYRFRIEYYLDKWKSEFGQNVNVVYKSRDVYQRLIDSLVSEHAQKRAKVNHPPLKP